VEILQFSKIKLAAENKDSTIIEEIDIFR